MENDRSHIVCTWDDEARCLDCGLKWKLGCRLDPAEVRYFVLNQVPSIVQMTRAPATIFPAGAGPYDRRLRPGPICTDRRCRTTSRA